MPDDRGPSNSIEMPCPHCGYDLQATAREGATGRARCPECGTVSTAIDQLDAAGDPGRSAERFLHLALRARAEREVAAASTESLSTPIDDLPLDDVMPCPQCGYNLRGSLAKHPGRGGQLVARCPECGTESDLSAIYHALHGRGEFLREVVELIVWPVLAVLPFGLLLLVDAIIVPLAAGAFILWALVVIAFLYEVWYVCRLFARFDLDAREFRFATVLVALSLGMLNVFLTWMLTLE